MKEPTRRIFGHSWLGCLNFILLRWVFVRLAYVKDTTKKPSWVFVYWVDPSWKVFKPIFRKQYKFWPRIGGEGVDR